MWSSRTLSTVIAVAVVVSLAGCGGGAIAEDGWFGSTPVDTEQVETERDTDREETESASNHCATPSVEGAVGDDNVTATFVTDAGNATVSLEVADNGSERRTGLMHRESLPENHGMVFVFPSAGPRSFWMKNTLVPLDIIFLDSNATVLNVEHADPQPGVPDSDLASYRSDGPSQYVIELEQGFANRTCVGPGTQVVFHEELLDRDGE